MSNPIDDFYDRHNPTCQNCGRVLTETLDTWYCRFCQREGKPAEITKRGS